MHPIISELFAYIDSERAALRATLDAIPAAERNIRPAPGRWSVCDVLEHLSIVENGAGRIIARRIAEAKASGLGPETGDTSIIPTLDRPRLIDRKTRIVSPQVVHPAGGADVEATWAALVEARERLKAAVVTGDGLALGRVSHPHPAFGELTIYQWIEFMGAHEARHAAQMREVAAELRGVRTEASA